MTKKVLLKPSLSLDKDEDNYFNILSAFQKSIRGSDVDAAMYYLARLIDGGESADFIARRLVILASEDIGNADPNALQVTLNAKEAYHFIGLPEGKLAIAQAVIYLATAPKSNSVYTAYADVANTVKQTGALPVPLHIRNAPTKLMKELDYGKGYKYAHDFDNNFTALEFLPEEISGTMFYDPGNNARENELRKRLKAWWKGKYKY